MTNKPKKVELHLGDCLEVLATLPENSIDTCITDPPYELGFMGKKWDSSGIAFQPETWQAVYRVLKPGALLLAFGGTRTYHRMVCAIEDAGFEIRDMVEWIYGSGFPKSLDIGKAIDKQAGAEREVVGMHQNPAGKSQAFVQERSDAAAGCFSGSTKYPDGIPLTKGNSGWDGWGTALKPAHEPIVVAMKPLDGTYVNNALTWGVAGLWIDGGRVEIEQDDNIYEKNPHTIHKGSNIEFTGTNPDFVYKVPQGRFPANLIHDGSDEVVSGFPQTKSGKLQPHHVEKHGHWSEQDSWSPERDYGGDSGSASRFFYCAKASRAERNAGLEGMPNVRIKGQPSYLDEGGINNWTGKENHAIYAQNHHPTVKPIELMRYLVRLTKTPTGGVVLDPFMGSGTTGIACELEGRDFIGIEREPEYIEIAERRIAKAQQQERLDFDD